MEKTSQKQQISGGSRIKLDVGGQIFATSLSTLTSEKGSYFEALFSGRWEVKPQEDGCYFIDRDPIVFRHVLNYLRGQPPTPDMLSSQELHLLKADADFYHLPGLVEYLNSLRYRFISGPNYAVSKDGLQISKTPKHAPKQQSGAWYDESDDECEYGEWDVTAITNPIPSSGIHHFKFRIVSYQYHGSIMFGVCPANINQSNKDNHKLCGWYCSGDGKLHSGPPQSASNEQYDATMQSTQYRPADDLREVEVKMDMINGQISFIVNGTDRGVAYTDIPINQDLCFCVLLFAPNDTVRIMD
jgi:hypothetical protein